MEKKYITIGLGGTFDHFHLGHQRLLDRAAEVSQRLLIGISTDKFAQKLEKLQPATLESFATRMQNVKRYCKQQNYISKFLPLDNQFGPTLSADTVVDSLCVSLATRKTADKINQLRKKSGLLELPIEEVALITLDDGEPLSSTHIRQGVASRSGSLYTSALEKTLTLSDNQRTFFAKVQGEIINHPEAKDHKRLVVGDSTLQKFLVNNWHFDLGVLDYRIGRKPYSPLVINRNKIDSIAINPAGQISLAMTQALRQALEKKEKYLLIQGEEDLAAVALSLLAPLEAVIYYGQPELGLVRLQLTENKKNEIYSIITQQPVSFPKINFLLK